MTEPTMSPMLYLIRHGEKPADGGNGLTTQGQQRAQCLRTVFGASSSYNIGYIIAEQPKDSWFPFTLHPSPFSFTSPPLMGLILTSPQAGRARALS